MRTFSGNHVFAFSLFSYVGVFTEVEVFSDVFLSFSFFCDTGD